MYGFYDARVPARVHSRPDFERWRREAERRDASALELRFEHLVTETPDDAAFPRSLRTSSGELPVQYRHEPGTEADGLTVRVPLVALPDLDLDALEWSVPGQRVELVESLIRSLPKRVRARFQPVEEFASGFLQSHAPGQGPLRQLLAAHLGAASGLEISPADFDSAALPAHLRPRVEVMEGETPVAVSRDGAALHAQLVGRAHAARAEAMRAVEGGRWCGQPVQHWPAFAPRLPVRIEVDAAGARLGVWGTLEPGPQGVRTAWTNDAADAERRLRAACRHFALAAVKGEVRHHLDFDPGYQPLVWSARGLGAPATLVHLAATLTVAQAWPSDRATPADEPTWLALLEAIRPRLFDAARATLAWLDRASAAAERLQVELERPAPADWAGVIAVTRDDREWLLDPERLASLDAARLQRVPAMLAACTDRLRRLGGGGAPAVLQALATFDDWIERANSPEPRRVAASAWREFVWLVREARLGLHAREGAPWPRARDVERTWQSLATPGEP